MSELSSEARLRLKLTKLARNPVKFIAAYAMRHKMGHLTGLGSVVFAVACATLSQYAIKHLVDVLSAGDKHGVWVAFGMLAGLIAADNLSWRVGGWSATHCFVAVTGDLRRDLFSHLTGHSPAFFADRLPGMLAGRITATGNAVYQVESTLAWNVLPPCLAVGFAVILLASVDPIMAVGVVGAALVIGFFLARMAAAGRPLHHGYAADAAAVDGELVDVINNMPLVRAFGAMPSELARFSDRVCRETDARGRSLRYLEKLRLFHAGVTAIVTTALLAWVLRDWSLGHVSTGDVVLTTTLGFTVLHGTRDLAMALVDTVQHIARLEEALATLLVPHDLCDADNASSLLRPRGRVEFNNVSFAYPGTQRPILEQFDLKIEAGTRVGLVGRSGSGKSTVLTLLQRLREVGEGQVLVDGQDITALTQSSLRDAIGVVPQDVSLFHRSVMENIRYGRPSATDEEVYRAAEEANCADFIAELSEGYHTEVGDRGVKLSGGQRQRLAIARAFLRNAPILLLDEATSALDSESEQVVQAALDRLMLGRTVIAVAHRLSTLRDFDRILVLDRGKVVQDGTPQEMEHLPGPYRELLRRQPLRLVEAA
jgi:ATP-binding cassette subfamily B protein